MESICAPCRYRRAGKIFYLIALLATVSLCFPASALAREINGDWSGDQFGEGSQTHTGDVSGASLTINSGTGTGDDIAAGFTRDGNVTGNSMTVNDGTVTGTDGIYGGKTYRGRAEKNALTINGGTVNGNINAGKTKDGNATENKVIINDGILNVTSVNGGNSDNGDASNNSITIYKGRINADDIIGGVTDKGNATGNTVTIQDGAITVNEIVGGGSENGNAMNNSVTIHGGTITVEQIIGGGNEYGMGNASGNSVTINGGNVTAEDIAAGFTRDGNVTGNSMTVNDGSVTGTDGIYGGKTYRGHAVKNVLTINGGTVNGNINAGKTEDGNATENKVIINDGIINVTSVNGGNTDNGDASNNNITIYKGMINADDIIGGVTDKGNATGNTVTIQGGAITANDIVGGGSQSGNAMNNTVTINGGTVTGNIYGGWSEGSGDATADNNTVTISGGTVVGDVYGGYAHSTGGVGSASNNLILITGGIIQGTLIGGKVNTGPDDIAINNRVIILGSPNLTNAELLGGDTGAGDSFTGNTVVVATDGPLTVKSIDSVENYEFVLPAKVSDGYTALTATDSIVFGNGSGNQSKVTDISMVGGGSPLKVGDTVQLFNSLGAPIDYSNLGIVPNTILSGRKGVSLLYRYSLENGVATVSGVQAHPQAKALSEGRLAGMAFVNQGGDLVAGTGIRAAASSNNETKTGLAPFFVAQGGTSRYDTGSHVDVDGFSLMTGLAWNRQTEYGKLLLGAFFEAGWGNYDSHNSFSGFASVKGDGDTNYYGGGLLGRFDFTNNIYTEASFRAGQIDTDFSSSDLRDPLGNRASYDSSSTYYGAHVGLGYIWDITDATSLDISTKYLWTHQDSDSVTVTGDPIKFKDMDSHRWRTGARLSHEMTSGKGLVFTPYIGAAYEHEFDGKAKATAYGYSMDAPDLKGGTGIGELGFSFKPSADSGFSLDLGVQGYTGVREGVTGSFQAKFEF